MTAEGSPVSGRRDDQRDEAPIARWSSRGGFATAAGLTAVCWLLMLAYIIDMLKRHDTASAIPGIVVLLVIAVVLRAALRVQLRAVTVLTPEAITRPAGIRQRRHVALDSLLAIAVVRSPKGWAIWLWTAEGETVRLFAPTKVFTLKAQSLAEPTAEYWAKVAHSPCGQAASAIYQQAAARQRAGGPLPAAPSINALLLPEHLGPDVPNLRYCSPTGECAPIAPPARES